jgi:hypothetical protein
MIGEGDCGATGGMKIGRGNRSTWRKPAPAPLCPPQIPLDQTRDRTRAAALPLPYITFNLGSEADARNLGSCDFLHFLQANIAIVH